MFDLDVYTATLAQDGAAGLPGSTPVAPGGTADPGTGGGGGGGGAGVFGGSGFLFIMLAFLVLMIVMSMSGQRREKKKREAVLSSIKKHDKVQTVGGVIGAIVDVKPDTVVLKVDESSNTRITFSRSAIQQVLSASGADSPAGGK